MTEIEYSENCILWVKWNNAWPESRQGTWESAGSGNDDPNGWLLSERLKEIEKSISDWKVTEYPTFGESLEAAFSNPLHEAPEIKVMIAKMRGGE